MGAMKVTGYQLREAIKAQSARRDFAASQFSDTLRVFPGEVKSSPVDVMETLVKAERAVATLQVAQMEYNLAVPVPGFSTLAQAIKLIGGLARAEKMWRSCAAPKEDRYSMSRSGERAADVIVATNTVTREAAHEQAVRLAKIASTLRQSIAVANATEVEIDLDSGLLS